MVNQFLLAGCDQKRLISHRRWPSCTYGAFVLTRDSKVRTFRYLLCLHPSCSMHASAALYVKGNTVCYFHGGACAPFVALGSAVTTSVALRGGCVQGASCNSVTMWAVLPRRLQEMSLVEPALPRVPAENARAVEEADGLLPRGFARNLLEASQATLDSEFPGDAAIGNVSPCALGGPAGLTQELEDAIDGDAEDDAVLTRARKRALLPGADATMPNFANSFQSCKTAATASLQNAIGLQPDSEMSILQQVQLIRSNILTKVPDLPDDIVRLITGATAVYRMRLSDMRIREQVLLLWIVEGGDHMRCHSGNLYFYASGAFSLHRGRPPQGTLARCKRFLLNLEGMFRMLPSNRLQNDSELLDSVLEIFDQHNQSAKSFLSACERAAQSGKSSNAHRRRPAFDEEEQAGAEAELSAGHTILADALTKVGFSMQRQLLEDKIFNLVVEWCDTAQEKQPGVSYKDCTVLYDQGPDQNVKFVPGSPTNNLYLHVPHALCDPVQDVARDRLTKFYSQTFWLHNDVPCMHQTWAVGASLALEALLNKQICDMACF